MNTRSRTTVERPEVAKDAKLQGERIGDPVRESSLGREEEE